MLDLLEAPTFVAFSSPSLNNNIVGIPIKTGRPNLKDWGASAHARRTESGR